MAARTAFVALLLLTAQAQSSDPPTSKANRLAKESSPYLLLHAHNPVDWYPWGPEAFAKAKSENKLVFLSIGYSSCHWCHVMERESFANADVAKILNESFVCIKVDREERPDIDQVYMTAINVLGLPGGWPLSVFLLPDGKPIVGGTYWPREDKQIEGQTVRGFKSVLRALLELERTKPKELREQADQVANAASQALARQGRSPIGPELDRKLADAALDALFAEFDPIHGGFGNSQRDFRGPKFPSAPSLELAVARAAKSPDWVPHVHRTLDRMALGGIYDQVGGGFHRYSTERTWTVPHFEKMLYDNAQLVELYARLATVKPLYRRIVDETLTFVERELMSPDGVFYSALDADSAGEEGLFYVWSTAELDAAIAEPTDRELMRKAFRLVEPNFEGKAYIFQRREDAAGSQVDALRIRLLAVRAKRPRPALDTKVLTAWNGQMIAAYAIAGRIVNEPKYTRHAERAAEFLLKTMKTPDGRLLRTFAAVPGESAKARHAAYLDDYAYLTRGLLALHDVTSNRRWLDEAKALTDLTIRLFADEEAGGFYYTASDGEKLFARAKDMHDGAQPSGNSVTVRNLIQLAAKTGDGKYRERAAAALRAFAPAIERTPTGLCGMVSALEEYLAKP
ncbi:MAG: thioredoxin domain-containing protein [Gemmataceae bacterium]